MKKDEKILTLKERINDYKEEKLKNQETIRKMSRIYDLLVIDEDGKLINSNEKLTLPFPQCHVYYHFYINLWYS